MEDFGLPEPEENSESPEPGVVVCINYIPLCVSMTNMQALLHVFPHPILNYLNLMLHLPNLKVQSWHQQYTIFQDLLKN